MKKQRHKNIPASYLVLIKENKVLLLRRFNTGYEDGNYSLPAGHVDPDENFSDCIIREAEEEVGIKLKKEDISLKHLMHRYTPTEIGNAERVEPFFVANNWDKSVTNKEPNKCDEIAWHSLDELPDNVIPYIKSALEHIRKDIFYSEFGWE